MSLPQNRVHDKTDSATLADERQSLSRQARAAVLTGPGRSAVAVIGLQGAGAQSAMAKCFTATSERPWSVGDIRFGQWSADSDPEHAEAVVVTPLAEDAFEIHCHGGPAAITRILQNLARFGVETIDAAQFGQPSSEPLIIREATRVLAACTTARTAAVALDQVRGALRDWALGQQVILQRDPSCSGDLNREIDRLLASASLGLRLAEPFRVVLAGPPNVGKSSLINAIVGYDRSITFDQAGTTRDVLHADTVIDGIPLRLSDTAGIHSAPDPIEQQGISRARNAIESADLVVRVTQPGMDDDWDVAADGEASPSRLIAVLNKADLAAADPAEPDQGRDLWPDNRQTTVAITGQGVPELMRAIVRELANDFPSPGQPVPLSNRQVQILREIKRTEDRPQRIELLSRLIG